VLSIGRCRVGLFNFSIFHLIHHGFYIFRICSVLRQPLLLGPQIVLRVLRLLRLGAVVIVLHVLVLLVVENVVLSLRLCLSFVDA
jgi:hypothetical protein